MNINLPSNEMDLTGFFLRTYTWNSLIGDVLFHPEKQKKKSIWFLIFINLFFIHLFIPILVVTVQHVSSK